MSAGPCVRNIVVSLLATALTIGVVIGSSGPAFAAAAKPAPVLVISNTSPRVGEVVTLSNAGTCDFGGCNDNLKWTPLPMSGPHLGTQIGTVRFPATAVPYSWSSPGNKQITLATRDGQSRLCCSGSTSFVITVLPAAPGAPTIGTATPGDGAATVSFTAPASNGGSPITGYTVTASSGGATATGPASPLTVTGLANGTPHTFTVHATNDVGDGPESAATGSVTPAPAGPPPAVSVAKVKVTETNGPSTAVFTVTLSAPAGTPISVDYATADSTAKAPGDYAAASGTVSFAIGEQTKTVPVTIVGDTVREKTERFVFNLGNPSGATVAAGSATATIRDND